MISASDETSCWLVGGAPGRVPTGKWFWVSYVRQESKLALSLTCRQLFGQGLHLTSGDQSQTTAVLVLIFWTWEAGVLRQGLMNPRLPLTSYVTEDNLELLILLPPCRMLGPQVYATTPGFM